jgi:hypothetical protein
MEEIRDQQGAPSAQAAPATILIGTLLIRGLEWAEHVDFLLSVRDEKFATLLQIYRDYGWWVIAVAALFWFVYEFRRNKQDRTTRGSIGSLVASVAFVSFLLGSLIAVKATGSLPNIIQNYGGNPNDQTCNADIDTSRLSGFAEDYRLILLCGAMDVSKDPLDDTRIAISSPFHIIEGSGMRGISAPMGNLTEVLKYADKSKTPIAPKGQSTFLNFQMWHAVALVPKDVHGESIKRAADVKQLGGRILTEPIGAWGSPMQLAIDPPEPPQPPGKSTPTKEKKS